MSPTISPATPRATRSWLPAFTRAGRSFLIGPTFYTSYSDADLSLCHPLKPQTLRAILEELHCTNSTDVDAAAIITGAMDDGTALLFKVQIQRDLRSLASLTAKSR